MRHIKRLLGILGAILLTGLYTVVQAESVTQKSGASPESDKNSGPDPSDPAAGSDKKSARQKNRKPKSKKHGRKIQKNNSETAVGAGSPRTSQGAIDR